MLYNEIADRQEARRCSARRPRSPGAAPMAPAPGVWVRTVTEMVNPRSAILASIRPNPEWNEVVVIAYGNRMVSAINGLLAFDCTDKDPVGHQSGLFGLQLHKGPATWSPVQGHRDQAADRCPEVRGALHLQPERSTGADPHLQGSDQGSPAGRGPCLIEAPLDRPGGCVRATRKRDRRCPYRKS